MPGPESWSPETRARWEAAFGSSVERRLDALVGGDHGLPIVRTSDVLQQQRMREESLVRVRRERSTRNERTVEDVSNGNGTATTVVVVETAPEADAEPRCRECGEGEQAIRGRCRGCWSRKMKRAAGKREDNKRERAQRFEEDEERKIAQDALKPHVLPDAPQHPSTPAPQHPSTPAPQHPKRLSRFLPGWRSCCSWSRPRRCSGG